MWVRADFVNGYVSEFQVYHGKQGQRETSLGERVVKNLSRALVGKYYTIYCDNYFCSVKLFNDLLKDSIYACGTLRSNRVGYPQAFKPFVKKKVFNIYKFSKGIWCFHYGRIINLLACSLLTTKLEKAQCREHKKMAPNFHFPVP